ncbi:2-amino-4-hydroxy-6-hydroxymethyldihydropteridine diphosphokinase [Chryseomicrobium excrementi]|uniref:2-amino-4-hydroxy-6-hydroxymethyldihydropteridine diphosphokinase n=1 Tax=Chryseomicrobium excrementi TaxID=2041346 RepID=A0A2M9EWS5_9BACL|nr:2-amino-4-hydroxy-6-hydroxymethyldihydropteridine diphosphokinase [Chryseomicrobium excrementi]PJK15660.1 2-amino-4-hydroxy-6-hydroxymethyldihydropteridine diphosphokinase [Chryseomicrobium excrementi]
MNTAYLSIGSNMGDRLQFLKDAVKQVSAHSSIQVEQVSDVYETDPVGYTDQAAFLNIAVKLTTSLAPHELLAVCQSVEQELGRKRVIRWGPRTVDLDILVYNDENIESDDLTIPHPRMTERAFVLIPLASISADPAHQELAAAFDPEKEGIRLWTAFDGDGAFVHTES